MTAPHMKVSHSETLWPLSRIAAAALFLAAGQAHAFADETVYDSQGRVSGRSHTDSGGTTHLYDASGRNAGSVTQRRK